MLAIELVNDRDSKTPADKEVIERVQAATYQAGAMVRISGNNILMSPPLVLTEEDVRIVLDALETGFSAVG